MRHTLIYFNFYFIFRTRYFLYTQMEIENPILNEFLVTLGDSRYTISAQLILRTSRTLPLAIELSVMHRISYRAGFSSAMSSCLMRQREMSQLQTVGGLFACIRVDFCIYVLPETINEMQMPSE